MVGGEIKGGMEMDTKLTMEVTIPEGQKFVDRGGVMGTQSLIVTAKTPTNIAVIKYWGKRDEQLILPLNSSLSVTLDPNDLAATTSIAASASYGCDRLWLNGKEVSIDGVRYQNCLRELRSRAQDVVDESTGKVISRDDWQRLHIHVASVNNFPTAAGLASSAAGFACLVYALAKLMGVQESFPGELSAMARLGSGSACRSLYGGFVKWQMGEEKDGRDSVAVQVASESHWTDLRVLIAVVSDRKKDTSSTSGMQQSVLTSPLLQHRVREVVPKRMEEMEAAISNANFSKFAPLVMSDSNQFHATCLDTSPPIFYLNDTSRKIIMMVERWNKFAKKPMAAYTFDAGPNAVLFTEKKNASSLLHRLLFTFPPPPDVDILKFCGGDGDLLKQVGIHSSKDVEKLQVPEEMAMAAAMEGGSRGGKGDVTGGAPPPQWPGEVQYIISTKCGCGPQIIDGHDSALLDAHTGLPKAT